MTNTVTIRTIRTMAESNSALKRSSPMRNHITAARIGIQTRALRIMPRRRTRTPDVKVIPLPGVR
jgi:hypothetical protein